MVNHHSWNKVSMLKFATISVKIWMAMGSACFAQERLMPLAMGGNWMAAAYRESLTSPPSVCVVSSISPKFILRSGWQGLEMRIADDSWSLPTNVEGKIQVRVGDLVLNAEVTNNTDTMISAEISEDDLKRLVAAMDKASTLSFTVGNARTRQVSLNGSSRATNAFLNCAGVRANNSPQGQNPFR